MFRTPILNVSDWTFRPRRVFISLPRPPKHCGFRISPQVTVRGTPGSDAPPAEDDGDYIPQCFARDSFHGRGVLFVP